MMNIEDEESEVTIYNVAEKQYLRSHGNFNSLGNLRDTLQHSSTSPNSKVDIFRHIVST